MPSVLLFDPESGALVHTYSPGQTINTPADAVLYSQADGLILSITDGESVYLTLWKDLEPEPALSAKTTLRASDTLLDVYASDGTFYTLLEHLYPISQSTMAEFPRDPMCTAYWPYYTVQAYRDGARVFAGRVDYQSQESYYANTIELRFHRPGYGGEGGV